MFSSCVCCLQISHSQFFVLLSGIYVQIVFRTYGCIYLLLLPIQCLFHFYLFLFFSFRSFVYHKHIHFRFIFLNVPSYFRLKFFTHSPQNVVETKDEIAKQRKNWAKNVLLDTQPKTYECLCECVSVWQWKGKVKKIKFYEHISV